MGIENRRSPIVNHVLKARFVCKCREFAVFMYP